MAEKKDPANAGGSGGLFQENRPRHLDGGLCFHHGLRALGHGNDPVIHLQVKLGLQCRLDVSDRLLRRDIGGGEEMDFFDIPPGPSNNTHRYHTLQRAEEVLCPLDGPTSVLR